MENNNQNQNNGGQLQIELSPEVAEGIYANLAIITHSSAEVVMDFIRVLPGVPKANVKSRIVLAPEHAKRLLFALQDNIAKSHQSPRRWKWRPHGDTVRRTGRQRLISQREGPE